MTNIKSICVYCGASDDVQPSYIKLAEELGRELAKRDIRMVYGGGGVGLMGACARAAHESAGDVLGIMPRFLLSKERIYEEVEHRIVDDMHTRKQMMFDESDAFIVLPGGIGTLEEAVEILSWARLGLHAKPSGTGSQRHAAGCHSGADGQGHRPRRVASTPGSPERPRPASSSDPCPRPERWSRR